MLSLQQPQDIQRSYLMPPQRLPHPYSTTPNYNYNHFANTFSSAASSGGYDEDLYSSELTPTATPEIEPAQPALFSPCFTFDIRSPSAPAHAAPCSPKTTHASLVPVPPCNSNNNNPSTSTTASSSSSSSSSSPKTTTGPPPPSPPPPSPLSSGGDVAPRRRYSSTAVEQALEIARESREGAADPTVRRILEGSLAETWARVEATRGEYLMTRGEFAVFNFFQNRFEGRELAVLARRRYWEGTAGR